MLHHLKCRVGSIRVYEKLSLLATANLSMLFHIQVQDDVGSVLSFSSRYLILCVNARESLLP